MRGYLATSASMLSTPAFMASVSSAPSVGSPDICHCAALTELTTTAISDGVAGTAVPGDAPVPASLRCSSDASFASRPVRRSAHIAALASPASGVFSPPFGSAGAHTSPTGT